ncbi:MAG: FAD-binding oxidoreductase [Ramlibacter sp.]|nr:FAD-binding oxidoreductase [Ramlibacter sp.]
MSHIPITAPSRRTFIVQSMATAGLLTLSPRSLSNVVGLLVPNVTQLYSVEVARIEAPQTAQQVCALLPAWPGKVAIGGGRYSMGGQIALRGGLHLDMRQMNQLVWLRPPERAVRVQAGMRWRDLQDHLDAVNLAVKTMQSYSNFTVGGSVSVNAHGRYVGHGPVGQTVRALQLALADGTLIEATPTANADLFRSAIGGYGAVGVITEVELDLAENSRIERLVETVPLDRYVEYFGQRVIKDKAAVLHNADLLPPKFAEPVCITWRKVDADRQLTESSRLVPRGQSYSLEQNALWAMTELPGGGKLRSSVVHPLMTGKPAVKWLNHEASLDAAELEPRTRAMSTYVLQEYFIPARHFVPFARGMARILQQQGVEALNVSIRHSPADRISMMPWAPEDMFSFVLYYKQRTSGAAQENVGRWTRQLIDHALAHEGRYYLPYQLHATNAQFESAYPEIEQLRRVKQRWDPAGKFSNELWRKYL